MMEIQAMKKQKRTAGEYVREIRNEQRISLRQFAIKIKKTPTFVSRFERGDDMVPSVETLRTIAEVLGIDVDDLIFRANRVPDDLSKIVQKEPVGMTALLRTAQSLTPEQLKQLTEYAEKQTKE